MKKYILLCIVCALLLTSCGKIDNEHAGTDNKTDNIYTSSENTETASEEATDGNTDMVKGATSTVNLSGDKLKSRIGAADELYSFVNSVRENSESAEPAYDPHIITVGFKSGENEYILSYCGDDIFVWQQSGSDPEYFKPDSGSVEQLLDMLLAYSALGYVDEDVQFTALPEHTETSCIKQIADSLPESYCETRYYYIDDRTTQFFMIEQDNGAVYYQEEKSTKTDAMIGDSPYYQDSDFYEYFADSSGKAYYRPEGYDVFYYADEFEGETEPIPLAKMIAEQNEYLYSFKVTSADSELTVEVWQGDGVTDYILIEDGEISAMWEYYDGMGVKLMYGMRTDEVESGDVAEMIAHADEHMYGMEEEKEEDVLLSIQDNYVRFDPSEAVIGQEVEPTGIVEEWRRYISSEENPFTLEFEMSCASRDEYEITTFDNGSYYYRHEMNIHDKTNNLGSEEWLVDGRCFQSTYYLKEYDSREIFEWPISEYARVPIDLMFEDEQRDEDCAGKCERAYEVTIGNDKYICEEWSLYLDRLWKVYIKDGSIVAWEGDFYDEPTVNTVIRLEKTADSGLIKIPEGAKRADVND